MVEDRRITRSETLERVGARLVRARFRDRESWKDARHYLGFPTLHPGTWKLYGVDRHGRVWRDHAGKLMKLNAGPVSLIASPDLVRRTGPGVERLWDVEGDSDLIATVDKGMLAVIATTGGATCLRGHERHQTWLLGLDPREVCVVRDRDDAGRRGLAMASRWWLDQGVPVRPVELPEWLGEGADLRDAMFGLRGKAS
jgi:hypothetical protein